MLALLGSDCSFFIWNRPLLAKGVGDKFENVDINLAGHFIGLIYPNIHVSTAEAYGGVTPQQPAHSLEKVLLDTSRWKKLLINQFEEKILFNHPDIAKAKNALYDAGAWYASMSGSGSAVFGLFREKPDISLNFIEKL